MLSIQDIFNLSIMKLTVTIRLMLLVALSVISQISEAQSFVVEEVAFNSDRYDDYSPVYFMEGVVFCSNRKQDVMVVYASPDNVESANMWFAPEMYPL